MLTSAVLLRRSCTSWVGARLRARSEILLVCGLFCPPHLSETRVLIPLSASHAGMPFHFVYDTGFVPTTAARHDRLCLTFPVDLARAAARSTTGPETGHLKHGMAVRELDVAFDVSVRGSETWSFQNRTYRSNIAAVAKAWTSS